MNARTFSITPADSIGYALWLSFTFDSNVVEALKAELPRHARQWDPDRRAWRINASCATRARRIMARFDFVEHDESSRTSRPTQADAYRALHLREDAPIEIVAAVYRALAKRHHPDVGGSEQAMKLINAAYEQLAEKRS